MQDRIGFLINNLSNSNLEQKSKELKELLSEEYWPWFCDYMVVKRAAQEQNFHGLYASLLNALQVGVCMATAIHRRRRVHIIIILHPIGARSHSTSSPAHSQHVTGLQLKELWRMLVTTTYKYVKVLLASERIKTQSSERSLLKNLGSWLGRITIAQGQPVKHKDLDIKGTIIDAYEQGKMIAVLPFVNKARSSLSMQSGSLAGRLQGHKLERMTFPARFWSPARTARCSGPQTHGSRAYWPSWQKYMLRISSSSI